jgi:hypothetical protein
MEITLITESQLKVRLTQLANSQFTLEDRAELDALIPVMLDHIGSPDPVLRDDLIYPAFCAWIVDHKALQPAVLRGILATVLGREHLFYCIGEVATDSVFKRTFSMLLIPLILIVHRKQAFLTSEEILSIKSAVIIYLGEERDRRGFVPGKGWAHAIAHAADALDDLARCSELTAADLLEILQAVHRVICIPDEVYIHGEEERLVTAVVAGVQRGLVPDDELIRWITAFIPPALAQEQHPGRILIRSNIKNFLQSLYFRLTWLKACEQLTAVIHTAIRRVNIYAQIPDE